ncbi:RcnB family protein [Pseudomonas sp. UL073]|uniref:RcnB family protein n=1 Tax=Zestomonas insulae TaxID=2809017 RepID=A0ABS2I9G1_9GAMM|nr:anti-virulence regulator CigR family protein [Pseudomonas insulae]MBM7059637.1 RcnB family protein [Pseudomonas insulae]
MRQCLSTLLALTLSAAIAPALAAPKGEHGNSGHKGGGQNYSDDAVRIDPRGPSIDIGQVRIILGDNRELIGPVKGLPPGIQKNLARGKPLPPGIAKRFDSRLLGKLPRYDGYEWQQVGTDVVLVAIATGLIYEVLHNVLD